MKVVSTGREVTLVRRPNLGMEKNSRRRMRSIWSEPDNKTTRGSLAAQVVNAYPEVDHAMRSSAERIAATARRSYAAMKDTGAMSKKVRITRNKSKRGKYVGAPLDYIVVSEDPQAIHVEFGHLQGKRGQKGRRWIQGYHVMANAAHGKGANMSAILASKARRARMRVLRKRLSDRYGGNW